MNSFSFPHMRGRHSVIFLEALAEGKIVSIAQFQRQCLQVAVAVLSQLPPRILVPAQLGPIGGSVGGLPGLPPVGLTGSSHLRV